MKGTNFALELEVGIKDLFTQQYQKIKKEGAQLDKDFKTLKKTVSDIEGFQRMQESLERLRRSSDSTSQEFRAQEQELERYSRSLSQAGVNTNKLASEQRRLSKELKNTEQSANALGRLGDYVRNGVGTIVAGGATAKFIASGFNQDEYERRAGLAVGSTGEFSSSGNRARRRSIARSTGAMDEEVVVAQVAARQMGFNEEDSLSVTEQALKLNRANAKWDTSELIPALQTMMKNFNVGTQEASDLIYAALVKSGDKKGDLLDTINEYSALGKDGGLSAQKFMAMLIGGAQGGAFNYDKIADGLKEGIKNRLVKAGELERLLGHGKTPGEIERITNPELRKKLASAVGSFREADKKGQDLSVPLDNIMSIAMGLYNTNPNAAGDIMEHLFGVQWSEDIGEKAVSGAVSGIKDPQKILGDFRGALDENIKTSFGAAKDITNSWNSSTSAFSSAVVEFSNAVKPITDKLSKGIDNTGDYLAEHPALSLLTGGALAIGGGVGAGKISKYAFDFIKKQLSPAAEEMTSVASATSRASTTPSWMDHRLSGGSVAPTNKGWWQSIRGMTGKAGKWLGWAPALAFGAYDIYDAAQGGDSNKLLSTTAGVGGSLAGGAAGAYGGAALGTMVLPGVGTAVGSLGGGILGAILGEEGLKAVTNMVTGWFADDVQKSADDELQRLTPPTNIDPTSVATGAGSKALLVAPSLSVAVSVSPDFANSSDIEAGIVKAFRESTPALQQAIKEALESALQTMDYAQPSD